MFKNKYNRPTKQLGFEIYSDPSIKQKYTEVYGETFVQQCLDMAIKVVPNTMEEPKQLTRGVDTFAKNNSKIGVGKKLKGRYK